MTATGCWAGASFAATMPDLALVLTENLVGLRNQALGLAERAGLTPDARSVAPAGLWRRLPARFWSDRVATAMVTPALAMPGATAPGETKSGEIGPGEMGPDAPPRLVIGCGGKAAAVGAALRRRGHVCVQVQNPRLDPAGFDLIVVQAHDRLSGPNVVVTRTALHRVTPAVLAAARTAWAPRFAALRRPLVSVLLGGSNGRYRLDASVAAALAESLAAMARAAGAGLAVTPSRRTAPDAMLALRAGLSGTDAYVWDGQGENPYAGLLACADAIVVTGDSVSMMSEAAATAAPVLVARLPGRSRRIDSFTAGLLASGRVRRYVGRLEQWAAAPLDDTAMAARAVRALLDASATGGM